MLLDSVPSAEKKPMAELYALGFILAIPVVIGLMVWLSDYMGLVLFILVVALGFFFICLGFWCNGCDSYIFGKAKEQHDEPS